MFDSDKESDGAPVDGFEENAQSLEELSEDMFQDPKGVIANQTKKNPDPLPAESLANQKNKQPSPQPTPQAGNTLGDVLKNARMSLGIPQGTVASTTKINVQFLNALEENQMDNLPAKPYVRGFLRAVSKALNLNSEELLELYEKQLDPNYEKPEVKQPLGSLSRKTKKKNALLRFAANEGAEAKAMIIGSKVLRFVVVGIFVTSFAVYYFTHIPKMNQSSLGSNSNMSETTQVAKELVSSPYYGFWDKVSGEDPLFFQGSIKRGKYGLLVKRVISKQDHQVTKKLPDEIKKAEKPVNEAPPTAAEETSKIADSSSEDETTKPSSDNNQVNADSDTEVDNTPIKAENSQPTGEINHVLYLSAQEDVWIKFQEDEKPVRAFILKEGQRFYIRGEEMIKFFTGNLPGLAMAYNGQELKFGKKAFVKSFVFPKEREDDFEFPLFQKKTEDSEADE